MKLIGLTGGIGSGKSTVAEIFGTLGVPVYNSDQQAKHLMNTNEKMRKEIIQLFGNEAYTAGVINRGYLASRVFSDPALLASLNAIVHPAVFEDLGIWSQNESQSSAPYLIQESAILFEENLTARFPAIILVVANAEIRIARVMSRDNVPREKVEERMKHQWPDERKIPLSDFVIYNDGDQSLLHQVMDIDKIIRSVIIDG
jgi:dephospho-CoA kinase